jgi:hypothetical protein
VQSGRFNQSNRRIWSIALLAEALLVTASCGQSSSDRPINATIIDGQQFTHKVHLPSGFQRSTKDQGLLPFDRYSFRVGASAPEVLLVATCRHETPPRQREIEICSANSFAIDTAHSYSAREVGGNKWDQATPIEGFLEMDAPTRRTLKQELAKPPYLSAIPIGSQLEYEGYKYRGNEYFRRAKWISALNFGASLDGKLIVLAGFDRHHLYSNGRFTLDIFDSDPTRRIAALDVDYKADNRIGVEDWLRQVSLVNSRWLVMGLSPDLQDMLLFDFKPSSGEQKK